MILNFIIRKRKQTKNQNRIIYFFIAGIIVFSSCEKQVLDCVENCGTIRIKGKVYDPTSNKGIANHPVLVEWHTSGMGFFNTPQLIYKSVTDKNGDFGFTISIDKSRFNRSHIEVRVPVKNDYIVYPWEHNEFSGLGIYNYQSSVSDLNFEFYPITTLFIKLHRVAPNPAYAFNLLYTIREPSFFGLYENVTGQVPKDTTITLNTGADVFTKLRWTVYERPGVFQQYYDSIICRKNQINTFTINY